MKHSLTVLFLAALFAISAPCIISGNLEGGDSAMHGPRINTMESPFGDIIVQQSCHSPERTPTLNDFICRVFRWNARSSHDDKNAWPPLRIGIKTVTATILACAAACLSSAGGIGGGGLFVPILNLVLQFDAKTSAAVSAFMVLGGSIANVIYCVPLRHPKLVHKPLIDYDIALLLQPNMLVGTSLGVICNVMFPEWLIIALLASSLSCITFTSCRRSFRHWRAETIFHQSCQGDIERRIMSNPAKKYDDINEGTLSNGHEAGIDQENGLGNPSDGIVSISCGKDTQTEQCGGHALIPSSTGYAESGESLHQPLLNEKMVQPSTFIPLNKLAVLVIVWISFFLVNFLRGGQGDKSFLHVETCGLGYWLLSGLQIPIGLAVTVWMLSLGDSPSEHHGNQKVATEAPFWFPIVALLAGILGGMLGIGGGMLINPFLLQAGMPPRVTAATSAFMVFFSSSMSVAQFVLLGLAPMEYALYFATVCFVSSLFGLISIQRAITRYGRVSLIIFSVSSVMGISAILMTSFGTIGVWRQFQEGVYMGFRAPC